ncbi:MAG: site-specific integrase [Desulfarculus sp.]|nr:site-specific integrase [Desulfarculus sp.]MBV1739683.1 site-specific integrase [Desulfarculus sp.]MBV1750720.1 site-specific integrase [Desulfarculus sp.]
MAERRAAELFLALTGAPATARAIKPITPKEFVEEYLAFSQTNKRKNTFVRDATTLKTLWLPFLAQEDVLIVSQIRAQHLERYKVARSRLGRAARTINRELDTIRHSLAKAQLWEYHQDNPGLDIAKIKVPTDEPPNFLTQAQCHSLLTTASAEAPTWVYYMILTGMLTGLRRRELIFLEWADVDLAGQFIRVQAKAQFDYHTKTGRSRQIPINPRLDQELREWKEIGLKFGLNGPWVFGLEPHHHRWVSRWMQRLLTSCGLYHKGLAWHTLRHTFASHLAMAGCPMAVLAGYLGHSTTRTTELYQHLVPDLRHGFIKAIDTLALPE